MRPWIAMAVLLVAAAPAFPASPADKAPEPVRLVVGYAPGGTTDFAARQIAAALAMQLKQPVEVDNLPGEGGTLAAAHVARAAPDGRSLYVADTGYAIAPVLRTRLNYDRSALLPVALALKAPEVLVVANDFPARSVADLLAQARNAPGAVRMAHTGVGTLSHAAGELFAQQAQLRLAAVLFDGAGQAIEALKNGRADLMIMALPAALAEIRNGRLRALAVGADREIEALPGVPTFRNAGLRGLHLTFWVGLLAPKGTPRKLLERLASACANGLASPPLRQTLAAHGLEPGQPKLEQFGALIEIETQVWTAVSAIAGMGAKP